MKLRTEDALGYFSTQMLGSLALPAVTVDAQRVVMQGRRRGMSETLTESLWRAALTTGVSRFTVGAPVLLDVEDHCHCARCGLLLVGGNVCMNCDVDPPETRTFDTRESFWWLSYADDSRCAGVAIVRLAGEQSETRAAERARELGLQPAGEWQIAAIQAPEEERALMEAHADCLLTTAEAEVAFAAKAIKTWEAENPGKEFDASGVGVIEPKDLP